MFASKVWIVSYCVWCLNTDVQFRAEFISEYGVRILMSPFCLISSIQAPSLSPSFSFESAIPSKLIHFACCSLKHLKDLKFYNLHLQGGCAAQALMRSPRAWVHYSSSSVFPVLPHSLTPTPPSLSVCEQWHRTVSNSSNQAFRSAPICPSSRQVRRGCSF